MQDRLMSGGNNCKRIGWVMSLLVAVGMVMPNVTLAQKVVERPSPTVMVADALFARPIMLASTVVGTGIFLVTLPVSLAGGNAGEAGKGLVLSPFKSTFVRCLGCTRKNVKNPDHYYSR